MKGFVKTVFAVCLTFIVLFLGGCKKENSPTTPIDNAPNQPIIVSPQNGAENQQTTLAISWTCSNPDNDRLTYDIYMDTENPPTALISLELTLTCYQCSGLNPHTKYYWRVVTKDQCLSTSSPTWSFTTGSNMFAPVLITPSNNSTEINIPQTIMWNATVGATSYKVQVSTNNSFQNSEIIVNENVGNTTSKRLINLTNFETYYWRVAAINLSDTSWSDVWSFTTSSTVSTLINGKVTNFINQAVSDVKIYTSPATVMVYSDPSGNYLIDDIAGGTYTLYAEKNGYNNYSASVNIIQGLNKTQDIIITIGVRCPGIPTITYQGKTYNTVQIGNQCWLKENLDVGTKINGSVQQANNNTIEKYCFDNNEANCDTNGGLYQWAEAVQYQNGAANYTSPSPAFTGNVKGICPTGWHIPTETEFETLKATVYDDGNELKAVGQGTSYGAGTNTSGFSALLSGYNGIYGYFGGLGNNAFFWSSTVYDSGGVYYISLGKNGSGIGLINSSKYNGFSIRCLKD
ncbi:MAG: FISUMP domain-containing protein [bacterium]